MSQNCLLTVEQLRQLIPSLCYHPHPNVAKGSLRLAGAAGDQPGDSACVSISPYARFDITGDITIGRWVMVSHSVRLLTHEHLLHGTETLLLVEDRDPAAFTRVFDKTIGDDVWLFESTILAACTSIATGVVVGTGSIVTRPITESYTIWAGNPARQIGHR